MARKRDTYIRWSLLRLVLRDSLRLATNRRVSKREGEEGGGGGGGVGGGGGGGGGGGEEGAGVRVERPGALKCMMLARNRSLFSGREGEGLVKMEGGHVQILLTLPFVKQVFC